MILDRLRFLDPRRFFKKKEPAEAGEADALAPEIEDEAVHPDKDEVLKLIRLAVQLAFIGCYAFMVLFCLQFVGKVKFDIDWQWGTKGSHFSVDIGTILNLLPLFAVLVVSFGILVYAKAWVTYFAEEKERVAKWLAFSFGMMSIGVVVLGSLSVNQEARQEDFRTGLIAEEQVENKAAGNDAVIQEKRNQLQKMKEGASWPALAAKSGGKSWREKVALAKERNDPRLQLMESVQTDADEADRRQAEIEDLIAANASRTTKAEVKADVGAVMDDPVTKLVRDVSPWRMPLMVMTMDLILVFGLFLGRARYKRLQAEWNAAIRRKADAQTQQTKQAAPDEQDAEDKPQAANSNAAGTETETGGDTAQAQSTAETAQTVEDDIFVAGYRRRKTKQRRLRPATLDELRAAGLVTEPEDEIEAVNDRDGTEGTEADQPVDESRLDESAAGAGDDPAGDLGDRSDPEAPVLDDEPDAETMSEEMDRAEQGTENEEGTEAQSVQTEEEVA